MKSPRELEKILKGCASRRRLEIMSLLQQMPELSVVELASELKVDFRTASEHTRKLVSGGLIMKRSDGKSIRHALTTRGRIILMFCRTLE